MKCRICSENKFDTVLDMGMAPLVNSLLNAEEIQWEEQTFPLKVVRCRNCGLAQLDTIVDSHKIYRDQDYLYFTGDMPQESQYIKAFDSLVLDIKNIHSNDNDLIVEIGSNDGTVISKLAKNRRILGVDPSTNVVVRALSRGVPTVSAPFLSPVAHSILKEFGHAKVIGGANCLAHIDDIHSVMKGINVLLDKDGVFWGEVNYWGGMVQHSHYALVYLDHYSYFSLQNWMQICSMHGLEIFDAFVTEAQGTGLSLRFFASRDKKKQKTERFNKTFQEEVKNNWNSLDQAISYGKNCKKEAEKLFDVVEGLKKNGKSIAGYGAAAKGFSVLQLAGIDASHISYFVDDSPAKQGKFTPITHIPVISRKAAESRLPDYFFITAPNYVDVITKKEEQFRDNGGQFILCDGSIT
ncbi:class I SAM-dependent methyltransferase [bacterium]|nr:class I SAM-dependent methyltransferase [bacterium]